LIITLVFEKNANFIAEHCQKSRKIVIITSVPGHPACNCLLDLERHNTVDAFLEAKFQNLHQKQNTPFPTLTVTLTEVLQLPASQNFGK
jgi:hypothetical protein